MYVAGVDIGSTTTKAVIVNQYKKIAASSIMQTGVNHGATVEQVLAKTVNDLGITTEDIAFMVATGYGRANVSAAQKQVTEIACHGKGAHFLFEDTGTIIDIGGQDSKIIKVNKKGKVIDFLMNDKCAAGTGRFLELMAKVLEIDIADMGALSEQSKQVVEISSMCGIFAESEVISKIASGCNKEDIIKGIHNSITQRIVGMVNRIKISGAVTMTGGGAKNTGLVQALENALEVKINVPEEPQIVGAAGAALIGWEELI